MSKKLNFIIGLTITLLLTSALHAEIAWDETKFMPLDEIEIGMKGTARTVFHGTKIEEFEIEVVSVQYNAFGSPDLNIIWAKCTGENVEATGVAGGMSGSPGEIGGRIFGALAYGYSFQRESSVVVGFTPIETMISVTKRGMTPNPNYAGAEPRSDLRTAIEEFPLPKKDPKSKIQNPKSDRQNSIANYQLKTPIAISVSDPKILDHFAEIFEKNGMNPLQASSGGAPISSAPIEAGQIVGIEYARGDFTAFGYGTITHIDGDEIIAFGHPMNGAGHVNLPVSGGYVHYIHPSITRSFKVASATQPIGTLVQDRLGAIAAVIGDSPSYIPVHAKVTTIDNKIHDRYFEVIRDRSFSSLMAMLGTWNLIDSLEMTSGDHEVTISSRITLKNDPTIRDHVIESKNVFSSSGSPGFSAFRTLSSLSSLVNNPYAKIEIEKIEVEMEIEPKRKTAIIEGVRIEKNRFRPGETVEVAVIFRPHLEAPIIQKAEITVPKNAPIGPMTLLIASGSSYLNWQRQRAPLNYRPMNVNQMIRILEINEQNNHLVLELFVRRFGMTVQGEEFPDLPASMLSVMNAQTLSGEGGYTRGKTLHVERTATDHVLAGSRILRLQISEK